MCEKQQINKNDKMEDEIIEIIPTEIKISEPN